MVVQIKKKWKYKKFRLFSTYYKDYGFFCHRTSLKNLFCRFIYGHTKYIILHIDTPILNKRIGELNKKDSELTVLDCLVNEIEEHHLNCNL